MWGNLLHLNFALKFHNNLCAFPSSFHGIHDLAQTTSYSHPKLVCLFPVIFLISHSSSSTCTVSFGFRHSTGLGRAVVVASLTPGSVSGLSGFCAAFSVVADMLSLLAMVFWFCSMNDWSTECQPHTILIKNAQFTLTLTTVGFILAKACIILIIPRCINWRMSAHFALFWWRMNMIIVKVSFVNCDRVIYYHQFYVWDKEACTHLNTIPVSVAQTYQQAIHNLCPLV